MEAPGNFPNLLKNPPQETPKLPKRLANKYLFHTRHKQKQTYLTKLISLSNNNKCLAPREVHCRSYQTIKHEILLEFFAQTFLFLLLFC
jgi:hypothetical protein